MRRKPVPYKQVDPKISGGLTNILSYKWFDLAFTLSYSLGGYSFDKTGTYIETDGASEGNRNLPIYELDRWQKPVISPTFPVSYWDAPTK